MKNPLMLLLIIFLLGGCSSQEENGNIIVSFEGIKEDTIFIASWPPFNQDDSKEQIDTVFIENGKLKYQLNINELNKVAIIPKSSAMVGGEMITSSANIINIWMDQNDEVRINAKIDGNYIEYNTSGNAFSQQQSEARQMILPILKESHELRVKRQLV